MERGHWTGGGSSETNLGKHFSRYAVWARSEMGLKALELYYLLSFDFWIYYAEILSYLAHF
jgi:hypothetical protein